MIRTLAGVMDEDIRALLNRAQELEELADSMGGYAEDYAAADEVWEQAFTLIEQRYEASGREETMQAWGFSTPAQREAQGRDDSTPVVVPRTRIEELRDQLADLRDRLDASGLDTAAELATDPEPDITHDLDP